MDVYQSENYDERLYAHISNTIKKYVEKLEHTSKLNQLMMEAE